MIAGIIETINNVLLPYGAVGVFVASLLEEVIAPIPSALVQTGAGFFLISQSASPYLAIFFKIAVPAALGVAIGSLFVYYLVYFLGKPIIDRYGKWLALRWQDVEAAEKKFESGKKDGVIMFVLRALPIIPSVAVSAFCGLVRFNLKTYLLTTFLGTLVRASVLGWLGWQAGELYYQYAEQVSHYEKYGLVMLVVLVLTFVIYRLNKVRKLKLKVLE